MMDSRKKVRWRAARLGRPGLALPGVTKPENRIARERADCKG